MKKFGLIGKKLSHSFSRDYFTEKFEKLKLENHTYELFELAEIAEISRVLSVPNLIGLNVTVPYKQAIIPFLKQLDHSAQRVGAVNVIKIEEGKAIGYNSDYLGFKISLENWLPKNIGLEALVLGTGGAAKAVITALEDLGIPYQSVSRNPDIGQLSYSQLNKKLIEDTHLIINTTPLGMWPNINSSPTINYQWLTSNHYLYDLVYNPELTVFLKNGQNKGANIKNGIEMLHLQAEESWRIWINN
ncbi:MAG TPA: shikimate dehydrogenase [Fulvivirga sp.]|nr:shikimate dehydrogenase [Fulvivirga sp.]